MKSIPPKMEGPTFLSGWKQIANYLGKGVRTLQRYERELGFPVRRPAGKSRAAVIATKVEVDAWVAASPIRREFRLSRAQTYSQTEAFENIKKHMEKMGALRDQMAALRIELRASTRNLAESIERIHREIDNRWRQDKSLSSPHLEPIDDGSAHSTVDLWTKYETHRKAN